MSDIEQVEKEEPGRKGWNSLFEDKVRRPVSVTLTKGQHRAIKAAAKRLRITRNDAFGLLVELYADLLTMVDTGR